uniref:Uncharacterized protein n=1 Tax=Rhizophora mucronata TaxID=61149 RepID=A0A2P2N6E7_RHIMU
MKCLPLSIDIVCN